MKIKISDAVKYIGCDDHEIDLFESQYIVPNGVSYNSYLIMDEKIALMDTVDRRATDEWFKNLETELDGKTPDYLVVHHMEPDHAYNILAVCKKYPDMKIVSNAKVFNMIPKFFDEDLSARYVTVKEGDTLSLGSHTLTFVIAPMVHWPEVMVSYESKEKILFSADGFGKFGALDYDDPEGWDCEARRYYINIVGKYGAQVQALLKKAAALDIATICPLHGPVLSGDLSHYLKQYDTWSSYRPEKKATTIAYASIHGNTEKAAKKLGEILAAKGEKVKLFDLSRDDMAECIESCYEYDKLVLASPTYDGALFPCMEDLLYHLKIKNFQQRKIGFIENGSWAPMSGKLMKAYCESYKNCVLVEPVVTIASALKESDTPKLEALADAMLAE